MSIRSQSAIRYFLGLLLVGLLTACGSGGSTDGSDGDSLDAFATEMLAAVNQERAAEGLAALSWDDRLAQAAADHAQDMIDNDFFSHTGSDGSDVGQRVTRVGYQWSWVGENIARGQTSINQVMTDWMNSPGHRANILHESFTQIGAVRVGNHWVQVFARPSSSTKPAVDVEEVPEADG